MLSRIDHIGVVVDDIDEAKRFLEGLGLECSMDLRAADSSRGAFFKCGDVSIALVQMDDPEVNRKRLAGEPLARIEHICFEVDSLSQTMEVLSGLGVKTSGAPYGQDGETGEDPLLFGATTSVFTRADTSDGYVLQFIESKAGSIAQGLAQSAGAKLGAVAATEAG
jgi:methylmalonyl-CoA/ethylmalonyl-CoA epimerase